ncbi:suppressor of fused domain protein [Luteolibacter sp. Populi]|uniref:suppressor of fused domain protein n=1 Tax=Luteolibacter sp. Populi TaxID=3230487 RepID=UPI0034663EF3
METVIVFEASSPHGNLEAIVEQDERVAYLYVSATENDRLPVKSCWVRNLGHAPEELDRSGMNDGIPPMLPRRNCRDPQGASPLETSQLEIVWFPEGDGVALLEKGEMLAVIPPWGIVGDFPGYARDALGESKLCWGLQDDTLMRKRISEAIDYWEQWDAEESPWAKCQNAFLNEYERVLGPHSRYFGIDGGRWPAKALIQTDLEDGTYLSTLGISLRPQPQIEMYCETPSEFRRFEFAACFAPGTNPETIPRMAAYLSGQSSLPWQRFTFLGNGHTIPCDAFAGDSDLCRFTSVLLVDQPESAPQFSFPTPGGDRISLLWVVPITEAEREIAVSKGSKELIASFPANWPLHVIGLRPAST